MRPHRRPNRTRPPMPWFVGTAANAVARSEARPSRGAGRGARRAMTDPDRPPAGHVVLAQVEGDSFVSLRRRPTSRAERYQLGRSLRETVTRSSLGDWTPPGDRPDPVDLIIESHRGRVEALIPLRVG